MTVIVGLEVSDGVWLASDSMAINGNMAEYGVVKLDALDCGVIIGSSGWGRFQQLLKYDMVVPEHAEGISDMQWLVATFAPAVYETVKRYEFHKREDGRPFVSNEAVLAYRGRLYNLDTALTVQPMPFSTAGCGEVAAVACKRTLERLDVRGLTDEQVVKLCVSVASDCDLNCGGEIQTMFQAAPKSAVPALNVNTSTGVYVKYHI